MVSRECPPCGACSGGDFNSTACRTHGRAVCGYALVGHGEVIRPADAPGGGRALCDARRCTVQRQQPIPASGGGHVDQGLVGQTRVSTRPGRGYTAPRLSNLEVGGRVTSGTTSRPHSMTRWRQYGVDVHGVESFRIEPSVFKLHSSCSSTASSATFLSGPGPMPGAPAESIREAGNALNEIEEAQTHRDARPSSSGASMRERSKSARPTKPPSSIEPPGCVETPDSSGNDKWARNTLPPRSVKPPGLSLR